VGRKDITHHRRQFDQEVVRGAILYHCTSSLLQLCGPLTAWDRVEVGGQPKSFGFAKFANGEGAQRALRLLNGLRLGSEELLVRIFTCARFLTAQVKSG
jgi:hypothetical protein